jgi:hypothetical protein
LTPKVNNGFVLAVTGVAVVGTVLWFATRGGEQETEAAQPIPASAPASGTPAHPEGATATHPDATHIVPARPTVAAEAPAVALPIDVSPGFEDLNKPAAEMKDTDPMWPHWRRHQELQSEPRDEVWAPRMEATLRDGIHRSLLAQGLDTERIELSVLECRTNACEIQAVGYPEDNRKPGVDLQIIMFEMLAGTLGDDIDRDAFSISMTVRPDQRLGFLVQLPRKKN